MYQRAPPPHVWEGFEIDQPGVGKEWGFLPQQRYLRGRLWLLAWEAKLFSVSRSIYSHHYNFDCGVHGQRPLEA